MITAGQSGKVAQEDEPEVVTVTPIGGKGYSAVVECGQGDIWGGLAGTQMGHDGVPMKIVADEGNTDEKGS